MPECQIGCRPGIEQRVIDVCQRIEVDESRHDQSVAAVDRLVDRAVPSPSRVQNPRAPIDDLPVGERM